VNVYAVPLVNPVTVIGEPELVAVIPPGELVALYPVILAGTPKKLGAVKETVA
jgi:hypothetical protein